MSQCGGSYVYVTVNNSFECNWMNVGDGTCNLQNKCSKKMAKVNELLYQTVYCEVSDFNGQFFQTLFREYARRIKDNSK